MADQLIPDIAPILDANGDPIASGTVTFYESGTTSLVTVYSDEAGTIPLTNPVELDAGGRAVQVFYASAPAVKAVIKDSGGSTIRTIDPIQRASATNSGAANVTFSPITGNTATNVQAALANAQDNIDAVQANVEAVQDNVDNLVAVTRSYLTSGTGATFTTPAGAKRLVMRGVGAGGGGGGVDGQGAGNAGGGAGGGSGGSFEHYIASPAASYTYTIGAAGSGGSAGANNGSNGGATTISDGAGMSISAGGGSGGGSSTAAGGATSNGALGGTTTGADVNIGGTSSNFTKAIGGLLATTSNGGSSPYGGGGRAGIAAGAAGDNATGFGAGGGGASVTDVGTNYAGGNGTIGLIIVDVYY